jgi:DNA-binding transcriptional ArsR family regulator
LPSGQDGTIPGMERDQLKRWLEGGLSLTQIGNLTQRDPSTVAYWVEKYGFTANGRAKHPPRGRVSAERLEPLIATGATAREMAEELDVSESTIRYHLKKNGLRTLNGVGRRALVTGRKLPVTTGICPRHGKTDFVLEGRGSYRCKRCRSEGVSRRRRRLKELLVEEAGGRCALCGYHRCVAALQFHHLDPSAKAFGLAQKGMTRSIKEARREAEKCLLVCSNCHAEIEAGARTVPLQLSKVVGSG